MSQELVLQLKDPVLRQAAAKALLQALAVDDLVAGTRHRDPAVRHGSYWVLDRCQGPGVFGVFPALLKGLEDPHPKVRALVESQMTRRLQAMSRHQLNDLRVLTHPGLKRLIAGQLSAELERAV